MTAAFLCWGWEISWLLLACNSFCSILKNKEDLVTCFAVHLGVRFELGMSN